MGPGVRRAGEFQWIVDAVSEMAIDRALEDANSVAAHMGQVPGFSPPAREVTMSVRRPRLTIGMKKEYQTAIRHHSI